MNEFVNRVLKPIMLPMAAGVFVFVLVFAFSRVLLAVPELGSTTLAMLISAEILGVASVLAAARRVNAAQKLISATLGLALIAGGGVAAAIGEREIGHHGDDGGVSVTAQNIAFLEETVEVPADEAFEMTFENLDAGVPHNVSIYTDESAAESLFIGEIFNGVATQVYEIPALAAGSHYFQCDVHPAMAGTVVAGEGGGGGGHGTPSEEPSPTTSPSDEPTNGAAPTSIEITAKLVQFDKDSFTLAADTPTEIVFVNDDQSIEHNVAIYTDESTSESLFVGERFFGVETRTYNVPPIAAGEYYFICDVHPNMSGTAIFE